MKTQKATVLCVDDEELILDVMADYLEDANYNILQAANGLEALQIFRTKQPDVVFVDLCMPVMNGFELLSKIRAEAPETPVIVVSGIEGKRDLIQALRLGAWNFISKPIDNLAILEHVLSDALEKARLIRENRVYKENLEKLVQQKTHDLETTNKQLQGSLEKLEQEIEERKRIEKALTKTRSELEARVWERTQDLLRANVQLKKEIEERLSSAEEKKRLEIQLQQIQKIEALGTLAGGIAHDFNNLLYPIVGYTEMTMDDVPEGSIARNNLEEILKAAYRAKGLVRQILAFSRQSNQDKRPVQVQTVVHEAIKLLRATLPTTVDVRQHIDQTCGPIFADPTQIHQVIINLCTNAYHAMRGQGGILDVSVAAVELNAADLTSHPDIQPGKYAKLEIKDTGHGIETDIMDRIFEPYFTTKSPGEGTGMGLAVTHGIVKSSKGKISVTSQKGQGTTFSVYLPLYQTESVACQTAHQEVVEKGCGNILIVDDEETIVNMVGQMLERLGYQTTPFINSIDAWKAFDAQPEGYDLVITDMTMPDLTGEQLALKIKARRSDIPIILCTGFSESISEKKAHSIGISEFIMKPIVKAEMARIIRKVISR